MGWVEGEGVVSGAGGRRGRGKWGGWKMRGCKSITAKLC